MQSDSIKKYAFQFIIFSLFLLCIYYIVPKIFIIMLPFLIAYVISLCISPVAAAIEKKLRIPRKISVAILIIAVIAALFFLIAVLLTQAFELLQAVSDNLPDLISGNFEYPPLIKKIIKIYNNLPVSKQIVIDKTMALIKTNINSLSSTIMTKSMHYAGKIISFFPDAIIFVVVLFIAAYFFSTDIKSIQVITKKFVPQKLLLRFTNLKNGMLNAFNGYIKAQIVLMSITFITLFVGFSFLKTEYSPLLALAVSIIDMLPIFGTGIILIPWSLICLIFADYKRCIGLIIIYLAALLARQIAEPKIVGRKIGLHPIYTLISMYVFLKLFGIAGMIFGPLAVLAIISLKE